MNVPQLCNEIVDARKPTEVSENAKDNVRGSTELGTHSSMTSPSHFSSLMKAIKGKQARE